MKRNTFYAIWHLILHILSISTNLAEYELITEQPQIYWELNIAPMILLAKSASVEHWNLHVRNWVLLCKIKECDKIEINGLSIFQLMPPFMVDDSHAEALLKLDWRIVLIYNNIRLNDNGLWWLMAYDSFFHNKSRILIVLSGSTKDRG